MHNTLYLTEIEKSVFNALSADLREGWILESEAGAYEDSLEKMQVRIELMALEDPQFMKLKADLAGANSEEEAAKLVQNLEFEKIKDRDMGEIFFALGPNVLTSIIGKLLAEVAVDDDLTVVADFSSVRHMLYESL